MNTQRALKTKFVYIKLVGGRLTLFPSSPITICPTMTPPYFLTHNLQKKEPNGVICVKRKQKGVQEKKNKERKNVQCSIAGLMIERRGTDSSRIMSCTLGSVELNLTRKGSRLCTR